MPEMLEGREVVELLHCIQYMHELFNQPITTTYARLLISGAGPPALNLQLPHFHKEAPLSSMDQHGVTTGNRSRVLLGIWKR